MDENTKLGGIKQEFQEFKNSFQVMISDLRLDMERKFENTNKRLEELNDHLKTNIVDQMNESVMSIKDTIIDALKEDNAQLRNKVELLEKKLTEVESSRNTLEQYWNSGHPSTNPWWKIRRESYWSFWCNEYCNY